MRWAQHIEGEAGPGQPPSGGQRDERHTRRRSVPGDAAQRPRGLANRPDGDRPNRPPTERAREAADVVGVQMAEEDEGDTAHPEAREAGIDRSVGGTGVDQHHPTRTRCGQYDGVALPDVTRHDHPPRGRPPGRSEPGWDDHDRSAREHREQQGAATA
jgi:hypothetical protein